MSREEQREAFEKELSKFESNSFVTPIPPTVIARHYSELKARAEKAEERVKELEERKGRLLLLMVDGFYAGRKDEWQEGESYSEWEERCHDVLCDAGLDPYTNDGPGAIAKLRAALSKEKSNA